MKQFTLFLLGIFLLSAVESYTCSCAKSPSAEDSFRRADAVFLGLVLDVKRTGSFFGQKIVTLKVKQAFKGVDSQKVDVRTAGISASCGSQFDLSKSYLVYAYKNKEGTLETNLCTRTRNQADAGADISALMRLTRGTGPRDR